MLFCFIVFTYFFFQYLVALQIMIISQEFKSFFFLIIGGWDGWVNSEILVQLEYSIVYMDRCHKVKINQNCYMQIMHFVNIHRKFIVKYLLI